MIALDPTLSTGRVVTRVTDSDFSVPTTIDGLGSRLYAVNAHFGQPNPDTLPYEVVHPQAVVREHVWDDRARKPRRCDE